MVTDPGVRVRLDVVTGKPGQCRPAFEERRVAGDNGRYRVPAGAFGLGQGVL